jgi:hypothetical protein
VLKDVETLARARTLATFCAASPRLLPKSTASWLPYNLSLSYIYVTKSGKNTECRACEDRMLLLVAGNGWLFSICRYRLQVYPVPFFTRISIRGWTLNRLLRTVQYVLRTVTSRNACRLKNAFLLCYRGSTSLQRAWKLSGWEDQYILL